MFLIDFFLDILYPPRCAVCRDIIPIDKPRWLCDDCARGGFTPIEGSVCESCGAPFSPLRAACPGCHNNAHKFVSNYALFLYAGREREIILNLKYHFGPPMMAFVKKLIKDTIDITKLTGFDFYVPVPMYKKKEADRGFNQAHLLARALSELTGVPVLKDVVLRIKNTSAQSGLDHLGRKQNITGAFALSGKKDVILSKAILIVDDIYTTGSTMDECTGVLLSGGAKSVNGFTFCVVPYKSDGSIDLI